MSRVIVSLFLLLSTACEYRSDSEGKTGRATAAIMTRGDSQTVIAGQNLQKDDFDAILRREQTSFAWVSIELPTALVPEPGSTAMFSLDRSNPIVFSQSYLDLCNPADIAETRRCWLSEKYTAGEPGLSGSIRLTRESSGGLALRYEIDWQGMTDRFGPPQWHRHMTSAGYAVAVNDVLEVSQ